MSDRTTKERILDAAEAIMLEKSFHSVGLNEILAAVKVPKGSFYHYFASKEQFGVELLRHYVAESSAYQRRSLLSPTPEGNPLQRLLTFLESNVAKLLANDGKCPCLVVKLAAEVADFSEPMRDILAAGATETIAIHTELLREGISKKKIHTSVDAAAMAATVHDLWSGAMHRASISRDVQPLREAIDFIRAELSPRK